LTCLWFLLMAIINRVRWLLELLELNLRTFTPSVNFIHIWAYKLGVERIDQRIRHILRITGCLIDHR